MEVQRVTKDTVYEATVTFNILPYKFLNKLNTTATPTVINGLLWLCSGATITITNLLNGNPNDTYRFVGDGTTTLQNNTKIKTNTGANKLLLAGKIYTFTFYNNLWVENE